MNLSDIGSWASIVGLVLGWWAFIASPVLALVTLVVSVLIYIRQGRDQRISDKELNGRIDGIPTQVFTIMQQVAKKTETIDIDEQDPADLSTQEAGGPKILEADGVSLYEVGDVPLRIIADFDQGLRALNDSDSRKNLTLKNVKYALHKEGASGNYAWRLLIQDQSDSARLRVWKVSRGGRSKTGPTVTEESSFLPTPSS